MTQATATEPLADVQEGDWVIRETYGVITTDREPFRVLLRVTRRTARLIWIGGSQYRLSGQPTAQWAHDSLRLPKDGEVKELQERDRQEAGEREESGKEYSRKRERFISIMYQAARSRERARFEELLAYWEVGNWDDELDRIDAVNQPKG